MPAEMPEAGERGLEGTSEFVRVLDGGRKGDSSSSDSPPTNERSPVPMSLEDLELAAKGAEGDPKVSVVATRARLETDCIGSDA